MPYLSKLTRRLSVAWAMPLLLFAACASPDASGTGPDEGRTPASIVVSPDSASMLLGDTTVFSATVKNPDGEVIKNPSLVWSSSDTSVISISPTGVAVAVSSGSATVSVKSGSANWLVRLFTRARPVSSVALSPTSLSLQVGQSAEINATLRNSFGQELTGRAISWSSDRPDVAQVDVSGKVTAVAAGSATIKATSEGVSATAGVTATAVPPVVAAPGAVTDLRISSVTDSSVVLSFTQVADGAGAAADYFVRFAAPPISWSSATSVGAGDCFPFIDGTSVGAVRTCTVRGLTPATAYEFQARAFRGTLGGEATYGALSSAVRATTAAASVAPVAAVATVAVSPSPTSVEIGQTRTLSVSLRDAAGNLLTGRTVTWTSGNTAVATVTSAGVVHGVSSGGATITATSEGRSGTAALTVTAVPVVTVASVTLSPSTASLQTGQTTSLSATVRDAAGNTLTGQSVTWSSSATSVASVSSSGVVNGISAGTATITATSGGRSGTATVTVTSPPVSTGTKVLFSDSFESGSFNATQNGIRWTDKPNVDVTSVIARNGSRSARFKQGTPAGDGDWAELRFGGMPQLKEVFLQYWLYMPSGTESPNVGTKVAARNNANDKFFRLFAESYSQPPEVGASTWGGMLGREYFYTYDNGSVLGMGQGEPPYPPKYALFTDANRGRWVRVRIRAKVSGSDNRSGVIQLWIDDALAINSIDLHNYPPGGARNYYINGYLLGWANSGFLPGQMMYIDDFTISTGGFP